MLVIVDMSVLYAEALGQEAMKKIAAEAAGRWEMFDGQVGEALLMWL
jgi:hypothetical protein